MEKFKDKLKGAWNSSTIWFNTTGIVLLSVAMAEPLVAQWLLDNGFMWVLAVGNVVLRFKTTTDLAGK